MLCDRGFDVSDVIEEGLSGSPDPEVLAAATSEDRVLMTFDADFADVRNYPPGAHGGVVVFLLEDQRWQSLEGPVSRLLASDEFSRLEGGLAIVDERRVRYKRTKKRRKK